MRRIPARKDYERAVNDFGNFLKGYVGVCFYVYGSFARGGCDYGRSDIDGGLIFDGKAETDKRVILDIAYALDEFVGASGVRTSFNLIDRTTSSDGRFLSYSRAYTEYIRKFGKVISGPDYRKDLNGLDFVNDELRTLARNFCGPHGMRSALLYSSVSARDGTFVERAEDAFEKAVKIPKKLILLREGDLVTRRDKALDEVGNTFGVDVDVLRRVSNMMGAPRKFYNFIENPQRRTEVISLLADSLGCVERLITKYLEMFPDVSKEEARD